MAFAGACKPTAQLVGFSWEYHAWNRICMDQGYTSQHVMSQVSEINPVPLYTDQHKVQLQFFAGLSSNLETTYAWMHA